MYQPLMELTPEQKDILSGKQGESKAKMMECLVRYGDLYQAKRLAPITHGEGHLVTSFGIPMLGTVYSTMDELIKNDCTVKEGFTVDPRPLDYQNVKCNPLEKLVFSKIMYAKQAPYEAQLQKVGLIDKDAFSCTCYLPEMGNTPKEGDVLSWAESSAVVFANSVLGARCNRNSGILELFGSILGYAPEFGFLTDEGRKATWKIVLKTTHRPEAQVLGSAIGMKVMEEVPYVEGLNQYLKPLPDEDTIAYLKDFGAATASNGAVGLYHIDGITPEAKRLGEKGLLKEGAKTYVIDDAELERVYRNYPIMWKDKNKKPVKCFIGCPHLTYHQLEDWTDKLSALLKEKGHKKLAVDTILTTSPAVAKKFMATPKYQELLATGAHLSSICPLMYMNNPLCAGKRVMTNSNKLRTYSTARYYIDSDMLAVLGGK
jgi:predicted aconitase